MQIIVFIEMLIFRTNTIDLSPVRSLVEVYKPTKPPNQTPAYSGLVNRLILGGGSGCDKRLRIYDGFYVTTWSHYHVMQEFILTL